MDKKSYLNQYMAYNEDGRRLADHIDSLLRPIIDEEFDKGFSPFEISQIILDTVQSRVSEKRLMFGVAKKKEERRIKTEGA